MGLLDLISSLQFELVSYRFFPHSLSIRGSKTVFDVATGKRLLLRNFFRAKTSHP